MLYNRSGEKDKIARMAGLVPVLQQWHKKKVAPLKFQPFHCLFFSSARLGDLLQALLLAALVLDCRNSLLYGDLLWLQTGKSLL